MQKLLILRVGRLSLAPLTLISGAWPLLIPLYYFSDAGDSDADGSNADLADDAGQIHNHAMPDGGGSNFGTVYAELLTDIVIGPRRAVYGVSAVGGTSNIGTV